MLISAWIFQYVFGYPPCQMCFWQRHAHKAVIVVAVVAIIMNITKTGSQRIWLGFIALAFLASFALAFWHVGVEYKWWEGPKSCMTDVDVKTLSPADLLSAFDDPVKLPACSEAVWHFLGLSMAGWNALISLGAAILTFVSMKGRDKGSANV